MSSGVTAEIRLVARLSHWVNGDREDSRGQYLAFALVILFCIVLGVVIDVLAG